MKSGKTLVELAEELQRREKQKRDFIADTRLISFSQQQTLSGQTQLQLNINEENFSLTSHCHRQLSQFLDIPAKYYDRMINSGLPSLAVETINTWLHHTPRRRLIRTLDGKARAWLSDRYQRIDNYDLTNAILPLISDLSPAARIESCQISETKLYLKVVNPQLTDEVKPGDYVQSGFILSNSEVGAGSVQVQPLIYRLICKNGLVVNEASFTRYHLGNRIGQENLAYELVSEQTRRFGITDTAVTSQRHRQSRNRPQ